jgi:outer membrane protein OmpA-like peptidoglycan-associated protein
VTHGRFALVALVFACATPPMPRELDALERLRAGSNVTAASRRAPSLTEDADKLGSRAREEWMSRDLDESRRDALMATIKLKTALALVEQDQSKTRIGAGEAELGRLTDEQGRLLRDLTVLQEQIALLEKLARTKTEANAMQHELNEEQAKAAARERLAAAEAERAAASRARDEALERDASSIPGVTVRLEHRGDLRELVLAIHGLFDKRSTVPSPGSNPTLEAVGALLTHYPTYPAQIIGHTDSRGRHDELVALSLARAQAVLGALLRRGVDAKRCVTSGQGPDEPLADNKTPFGRARNNRVEVVLLYP